MTLAFFKLNSLNYMEAIEPIQVYNLSEEEENRIIKIVKQIKDSDIDEEQLRSAVTKAYDNLEEMGIGKEEVKGILHKLADFAKSLFE